LNFPLLSDVVGSECSSTSTSNATSRIVAYRRGTAIDAAQYLRDVYSVAHSLPEPQYVLNLCGDRYLIAVLIAAVMLRGKISLLPPNTVPATLAALAHEWPDMATITDETDATRFAGALQMSALLANRFEGETLMPVFPAAQIVGILFTSGSTGTPTANPRTWGSLCEGVRAEAQALGLHQLGNGKPVAILGTVPAQHSYGLESTLALPMQNGHALSADHGFYPADIIAALEALPRPRVLVTTPFHLRVLMEASDTLPETDLIVSATAPLSPQLAAQAEARFKAPLREIYGCTEAGQVAVRRTTEGAAWTLFPHVALTWQEEKTWVGGGHVGDARALGDVIEKTSDTQFLLHGRTGDLINIAGKRTSLAHLNFQLNAIHGVTDGIFVPPSDDNADGAAMRLSALVVTSQSAAEIVQALRERIDPVFLPRPLRIVERIPRNATGKVTHSDLRAILAAS
jgi:acyl-coenzyme A synthetase/AMP-(fatty) acid ligase